MSRRLSALLVTAVLALTGLALATPASAATRVPRVPAGLPVAIEPLATEISQTSCDPHTKPGTAKLASLLVHTYPGTSYNTTYACGTDGPVSEHYDGRAIDWMASIRNKSQYADARAFLSWLFATDSRGNRLAMARRLGVQYVIYYNRIWESWDAKWAPYNNCAKQPSRSYDTSCHRDHMHISLGWNGAMGATTFWTKRVSPTDYGPCRVSFFNWAAPRRAANPRPCRWYPTVRAPAHSSATKVALVRFSGARLLYGSRGPAVSAVQAALHVRADGVYGSATRTAVLRYQVQHRLVRNGTMDTNTWLALLRAVH